MMLESSGSPFKENNVVGGVVGLDCVAIVIKIEERDGKVKRKHFCKVV